VVRRAGTVLLGHWAGAALVAQWKPCFLGEHRVLAFLKERSVEPFSAEH